jgi:hypothetical protein
MLSLSSLLIPVPTELFYWLTRIILQLFHSEFAIYDDYFREYPASTGQVHSGNYFSLPKTFSTVTVYAFPKSGIIHACHCFPLMAVMRYFMVSVDRWLILFPRSHRRLDCKSY